MKPKVGIVAGRVNEAISMTGPTAVGTVFDEDNCPTLVVIVRVRVYVFFFEKLVNSYNRFGRFDATYFGSLRFHK